MITKIEVANKPAECPTERPEVLTGQTFKLKSKFINEAVYITINTFNGQPFEIFITTKNHDVQPWLNVVGRLISALYRTGTDGAFIAEELLAISDPGGWVNLGAKKIPSLAAEIGLILRNYLDVPATKVVEGKRLTQCPLCFEVAVVQQQGCESCTQCGWSRC